MNLSLSSPSPVAEPQNPQSAHPAKPVLLETKGLSLSYGPNRVLEDVSLSLQKGRITGLIGPSGSGKTSFLSCLNRLTDLFPHSQIQGQILLENQCLHSQKTNVLELRRRVGMIFQKPNPFPFSIRRNLELPLLEHGWKHREEREQRIEKALRDVGLWKEVAHRLNSPAHKLSGGQQQRLCIARALALEPEILLLDEPCSALDPLSSGVIEELVLSLRGKYTLLIVTHNLAQARRLAENVALFWARPGASTLVEYGSTQQIFESPRQSLTRDYVTGVRG